MCNIIINLINKKFFTLAELNGNIKFHNYGPFVKNKKLDPITVENLEKTHLRTSGAEMKTFVLNFAFLVGHRVDEDCPEWKLYITLREILTIVTAKTIHCQTFELLRSLVNEHHALYLQCFPYDTLKPKHHLMVHYARILQMISPTGLTSSMRFESYHKKFKNVANVITCRINLLTTFAKKVEYQIAKFLLNYEEMQNVPTFGRMEKIDTYSLMKKYNYYVDSKDIQVSNCKN